MAEDVFMNLATIRTAFDAADATVLTEEVLETGMTPFSDKPWGMVVHKVEFVFQGLYALDAANGAVCTLSTRQGLSTLPRLADIGTIATADEQLVANGANPVMPYVTDFLPGVIIATPRLSVYVKLINANDIQMQGTLVDVRIGFLTVPMTQQKWNEVNQTWALTE